MQPPRWHAGHRRGGLHGRAVTGGELGDLRRQIVFVGDILNTAARLEDYAKRTGSDLVISGALLQRLALRAPASWPSRAAISPCAARRRAWPPIA